MRSRFETAAAESINQAHVSGLRELCSFSEEKASVAKPGARLAVTRADAAWNVASMRFWRGRSGALRGSRDATIADSITVKNRGNKHQSEYIFPFSLAGTISDSSDIN